MADNTQLNAGSGGDLIASDDIGGVKHQRVKIEFGADGSATDVSEADPLPVTLFSTAAAYRVFVPAQAVGANKIFFDLFNASGSGKVLKVKSVRAIKDGSVAVTGTLSVKLYLTKTGAAGTGGTAATFDGTSLTAMTISEMDSASGALPAQVSGRNNPTSTTVIGAVICERHVFPEETNAAGYDHPEFLNPALLDVQPLVLREGEGLRVVQGAVASVGNIGFEVVFEAE